MSNSKVDFIYNDNHTNIQVYLDDNVGVNIPQDVVESWIKEGIQFFKDSPEETMWYMLSGNKLVFMTNYPDDRPDVYITKIEKSGYVLG